MEGGKRGTNMFLHRDQNHIIFSRRSSKDLCLQLLGISRLEGLDDRHLVDQTQLAGSFCQRGLSGGRMGDHVCRFNLRFVVTKEALKRVAKIGCEMLS